MKTIFYALFAFFISLSCFSKEKITVSGKIINTTDNKLTIRGESFEKTIVLKSDGAFSESFEIDYSGSYTLMTKGARIPLYLGKGSKLTINADEKDFTKTLQFSGTGAVENTFWQQKNESVTKSLGNQTDFYSLEESAYINKVKELKENVLAIYNKTKFNDKFFKENELKNINYFELLQYLIYPQYHAHYAKKEGFRASESFPKLDPSFDLDNNSEYLFSNSYKQLVLNNFSYKISKLAGETAEYTSQYSLPELKKIKSPAIRTAIIQNLAYEVSAGNPDAENLYNELLTLSSDTKFKENLTTKFNQIKTLTPGKTSPGFDYENFKGGKTSLESLKGKYVYIDVWATWCGPCRREIPSLQKVEEEYKGKNIEFVSMSIDQKKDYDKWRKMVEEKSLGGIQLFADNDWNSQFVKEYAIEGIPRFILIDPNGKIISADAPRPSDPKLIAKFKELGI
ncbi:TlpA family protein disulfide reductase [Flavobacterium sp. GCM10023249]|uniref:TlpA family protein disulfide reductase n=1 Tax=unclassified Flavobacterium TaxID=196869 RepID=UPI003617C0BF